MRYVSHRGNLKGPNPTEENSPTYIKQALSKRFDVEIDLWVFEGVYYLGHDDPQYKINATFLLDFSNDLWIHCKNLEALSSIYRLNKLDHRNQLHYFWHEKDRYSMTSHDWVISYPGKDAFTPYGVCMLPENHKSIEEIPVYLLQQGFTAVCSDYIENIKQLNS